MKRTAIINCIILSLAGTSMAQPALEDIVTETFYIADSNDSGTPDFPVPAGAVTYRVFVDMAPDWELQAIFGATNSSTGEIDTLIFRSTQPFFNNEDKGRAFAYLISSNNIDENTVLLDSWLSTGRSGNATDGVLKPEDTNGGTPAFPNLQGLLQNDDPLAGIPINNSDGNIPGTSTATWALIGITIADLVMVDDIDLAGNELVVIDGALTNFSTPLHGPNANNRVLIGQFTTAGQFSGKLNLQMRNSLSGEIQQWVAETPGPTQFTSPSLKWEPNNPPIVNITSPANDTQYQSGQLVLVTAQATDSDGTITQVEFFFNGTSIGIDDTDPYEILFTATSSGVMIAVATDDRDAQTTSANVNIEVNPYRVRSVEQFCNLERVCMPIEVFGEGITDVVGLDIVLTFDNSKIIPTGNIFKRSDLVSQNFFNTDHTIDLVNKRVFISVFLNSNAPIGTTFTGTGDIMCIEFNKRPAFTAEDSTMIRVESLQESFAGGGIIQRDSIPPGVFTSMRNTTFFGSLAFWANNSPIIYDTLNPTDYLITSITGTDANCDSTSTFTIPPDLNGEFTHDLDHGVYLSIDRDIGLTDVQSVINSFDAFLARKLLVDDPTFTPTIFQMIAMDVNTDGVISAGDVSQINQRSLLIIPEFRQAWNYNSDGTPLPDNKPSKDWVFVSNNSILFDPAYTKSSTFPQDNGIGFSKYRVPQVPFCIWTGIDNLPNVCPEFGIETYFGVLLGDVNGNYR